MKKAGIILLAISILAVIIIVIASDFNSTRPGKNPENPYEFNVDEFKDIDPSLIGYKETRQIKVNEEHPKAVFAKNNKLYLLTRDHIRVIDEKGKQYNKIPVNDEPGCIGVSAKGVIIVGHKDYITLLNGSGEIIASSDKKDTASVFTSVACNDSMIFVADAGNRKVIIFDYDANQTGEFEGESGVSALHGFIIPSAYFDVAVNTDGELWVVNPGLHSLQYYLPSGEMRRFWKKSAMTIEGFSGCCNPAHFAFLGDGSFVTSEKGLVRVKVYSPSGELKSVVAPPEKFKENGHAPDLAVDEQDRVWALDFDKKMIRLFEKV